MDFILRPWKESDAKTLARHLNNKKIWDNCRDGAAFFHIQKQMLIPSLNTLRNKWNRMNIASRRIMRQSAISDSSAERMSNASMQKSVTGFRKHTGTKGLATAALKRAIEHYFQRTDVIRLYATVYEHNAASMRVLEKAGFQKTGIHHKACFKNGQFIDAHYYELLKNKS